MTQGKKAETSSRPKLDPGMDGPRYQIFTTSDGIQIPQS